MATWILIAISYYAGYQPIEFTSKEACNDARQVLKQHTPTGWSKTLVCVKK
nr:MAG: hypothetical protein [Bacteriophage sp.]